MPAAATKRGEPQTTVRDPDEYLTPRQAGAEIGFTEQTIRFWIKTRRLRADRTPTGRYRIRRRWLQDALDPLEP